MTTIRVRGVVGETSRALKAKAALEARSLSGYLLRDDAVVLPDFANGCELASP